MLVQKNMLNKQNSGKCVVVGGMIGKLKNLFSIKAKDKDKEEKLPQIKVADEKQNDTKTSQNQMEDSLGKQQQYSTIIYLNDILNKNLGIRTISDLIKVWEIGTDDEQRKKIFLETLSGERCNQETINKLSCLLDNIVKRGKPMKISDNNNETLNQSC